MGSALLPGGVHYKRPYTKLFSFFFAAFFGIFAAMHNTIRNKRRQFSIENGK